MGDNRPSGEAPGSKKRGKAANLPLTPEAVLAGRRDRIFQRRTVAAFFVKLCSVALALWLIFTLLFGVTVMKGESMYPRLRDGDVLLYYRLEPDYHIGDVVTFTSGEGERCVGRIVAAGGDTVDMDENGSLLINGSIQDEEIFYPTYKTGAITGFPCTLSEGQVFLLCDMRTGGVDSRVYGAVAYSELDGKLIAVLRRRGI